MGAKVLIIGVGDVGGRFARLLGGSGEVDRLTLAGLCQGEGPFIADGAVELDLPPGVDLDEAVAFQTRIMAEDGIEAIAGDGTVTYTGAAR